MHSFDEDRKRTLLKASEPLQVDLKGPFHRTPSPTSPLSPSSQGPSTPGEGSNHESTRWSALALSFMGKKRHQRSHSLQTSFLKPSTSSTTLSSLASQSSSIRNWRARSLSPLKKSRSLQMLQKYQDTPESFVMWLKTCHACDLDLGKLQKLRILLKTCNAEWMLSFLGLSGYEALILPFRTLVRLEWREEQHDDSVLMELLRCIKAIATVREGCERILSRFPDPLDELIQLWHTDRKPAEMPTRKLMAEYVCICAENGPAGIGRKLRDLLKDCKEDNRVDFLQNMSRPRPYNKVIEELSELVRDYFWIWGHDNNKIMRVDEFDLEQVEAFRVPGGQSDGVEYQMIAYMSVYLRMLNLLGSRDFQSRKEMREWHALLWEGMDGIIWTIRKASLIHYPKLHLEIARYIAILQSCDFPIPNSIRGLVTK